MTQPLSHLYAQFTAFDSTRALDDACVRTSLASPRTSMQGLQVEAVRWELARRSAVDLAVGNLAKASEGVMWINECRCDKAYTERGMHEPNAVCGELDELGEALAQLRLALGDRDESENDRYPSGSLKP